MSLSEIRVNTTKTRTGVGTITYTETGPVITGIATASNFKTGSTNVHSTGVELANINTGGSTATFGGAISGTSATLSGALSGTTASFSGTVSIGGTLTYEDVTNIDSVGILTARTGIHIDDSITHIGDTNTKIRFPAADTITAETAGTERLRITSAGKVGIGTNAVDANLTVHTTTPGQNVFAIHADLGTNNNRTFNLYAPATDSGNDPYTFQTGNSIQFKVDTHEGIKIHTNGKVGIGISEPKQPLSIAGRVSIDVNNDHYGVWADGSTTGENHISVGRWYNTGGGLKSGYTQYGINNLILENNHPTASHSLIIQPNGQKVAIGTHITDGLVHIGQTSAGSVSADAGGDELVLESSGNTGLSILSPGTGESTIFFGNPGTNGQKDGYIRYYHESHSTTANRRSLVFITGGGDSERLRITSTGKVCINNDTALSDLHICTAGSSEQNGTLRIGGTSASLGLVLDYDQSSATVSRITANPTYNNNSSLLKICVDGDGNPDQLVLNGNGKIGINIADNTAATLQVRDGSSGSGTIRLGGSNSNGIGMDMTYSNSGNTSTVFKQNYRATNAGALMKFDSGHFAFHTGTAGTEHLRINSLGVLQLQQSTNTNQGIEWYSAGGSKSASIGWGNGNANFEFKNFRQDSQSDGPYGNLDFFTGSTSSPPLVMRMQVTGEVGINTTNPTAKLHVRGGQDNISAKFDNHVRIDSHTDGSTLVKGNGVTYVSGTGGASDGNWKDIFLNWRYSAGSFVAAIGDTTVKTMISGHFYVTAPNYGVVVWNEITNNNSWNSGAADMQIVTHNTSNYKLQIKHTSYYNTSNNFGYYIMFNFVL